MFFLKNHKPTSYTTKTTRPYKKSSGFSYAASGNHSYDLKQRHRVKVNFSHNAASGNHSYNHLLLKLNPRVPQKCHNTGSGYHSYDFIDFTKAKFNGLSQYRKRLSFLQLHLDEERFKEIIDDVTMPQAAIILTTRGELFLRCLVVL